MFKGYTYQLVNGRLVKRKFQQFHNLPRCLNQPLVLPLQLKRVVMVKLWPSPFNRRPATLLHGCDAVKPLFH